MRPSARALLRERRAERERERDAKRGRARTVGVCVVGVKARDGGESEERTDGKCAKQLFLERKGEGTKRLTNAAWQVGLTMRERHHRTVARHRAREGQRRTPMCPHT